MRAARADLVIGIGNPLRGDDGVGWWLARRARGAERAPLVRLVPQLTPELALEVAAARRVLFVDAWCDVKRDVGCEAGAEARAEPVPTLRPLQPGGAEVGGGHGLDPGGLVALAALFGGDPPPAWLLLVPAYAFPHGTMFSEAMRRQLPVAQALLFQWLEAESPHA